MKQFLILSMFLLFSTAKAVQLGVPFPVPPAGGVESFIVAPIGSVEFNPSTPKNYGLAISESVAFAKILPGTDDKHVLVDPYGFVGLFLAGDIGDWVTSNGNADVLLDYGVMVGLPKLDDTLPEVAFSYNFRNNSILINAAFPVDLLPNILVNKL